MTFWKGMEKLYDLPKVTTSCGLNLVSQRLTERKSTTKWLISPLGVKEP
jgi:hypothetical protein